MTAVDTPPANPVPTPVSPGDLLVETDPFNLAGARGRGGKPKVLDPTGEMVTYGRPSTLAGTLDDKTGLVRWAAGMAALGVIERPIIAERIRNLDLDDEAAAKKELYQLGDDATESASLNQGANYGSLIHQTLHNILNGHEPDAAAMELIGGAVEAALTTLKRLNIQPSGLTEFAVVNDLAKQAGSVDGLWMLPGGRLVLGDWKSQKKPDPVKWAIQLATYALATCIYDPTTETRQLLPDGWDTSIALVGHIQYMARDGEDACTIYEIPLKEATEAMMLALEVEEVRRCANAYATPVLTPYQRVEPTLGLVDRLQRLQAAGLGDLAATEWSTSGLPHPRDLTDEQAGHADALLKRIEQTNGVGGVDADYWRMLLRSLPDDLSAQAQALLKLNTLTDAWGPAEAFAAQQVIDDANQDHRYRVEMVSAALLAAPEPDGYTQMGVAEMTEKQAAMAMGMACAHRHALIVKSSAGAWVPADDIKSFIKRTPGAKEVLAAGRRLAKAHNLLTPKSSKDVLERVLLLALVADEFLD